METEYLDAVMKIESKHLRMLANWFVQNAHKHNSPSSGVFIEDVASKYGQDIRNVSPWLKKLWEMGFILRTQVKVDGISKPKIKYFLPQHLIKTTKGPFEIRPVINGVGNLPVHDKYAKYVFTPSHIMHKGSMKSTEVKG